MFDFLDGALLESVDFGMGDIGLSSEDDAYMESIESIPCEDDVDEALIRISMESVGNFYAIANAITVDEFVHYVQTNEAVIYESGRISEIMDKIKEWIKKAWAKVKGVFEKAISWIDSQVRNDKKFVEKYKSKIKNAKPVKMQAYKNVIGIRGDLSSMNDLIKSFRSATNDIVKATDKVSKGEELSSDDKSVDASKVLTQIRGNLCSKSEPTVEDFTKELKDAIIGSKSEVTFDPSSVLDEVENAKASKAAIKKEYNKAKAFFKNSMAQADIIKKAAINSTSRKEAKEAGVMKLVGAWNTICKGCISLATTIERIFLKAVNISRSQAKAAARKMAGGEKEDDKDVKEESFSGFLGNLELI